MAQTTTKKTTNSVEKSGVVFGFAITELVLLSIGVLAGLIIGTLATYSGFLLAFWQLAGVIVYAIFIAMYAKKGFEMNSIAYGIVFIVFTFASWGIFSLVTGILVLSIHKKKQK